MYETDAGARERLDRRERSFERLRAEGVPYIEHLPVLPDAAAADHDVEDVLDRMLACLVVAIQAETGNHDFVASLVDDFEIGEVSAAEADFLDDPEPAPGRCRELVWQYECAFVLLWALSLVGEMPRPATQCSVPLFQGILGGRKRADLLRMVRLRPVAEILDNADLAYRYAWAGRQEMLTGRQVATCLDAGVALERHRAFSWLTNGGDWDKTDTST